MNPIESMSDALNFLKDLHQKELKPASIRKNLTNVKDGSFMQWLKQETQELKSLSNMHGPDHILNKPELKNRFQSYYELFITVEDTFNSISIAGNEHFGTTLSKNIVKEINAHPQFVGSFLDIVSLDKRRQFEALLYSTIPEKVETNQDSIGIRDVLANLPSSMLSPASMELMDSFLHTLEKTELSRRFEMMARVDAYIRSGWARNDLESESFDGRELRNALNSLAYSENTPNNKINIDAAREALFTRFDQLFHVIQIKDGMAIHKGIFAIQPGYSKKRRSRDGLPLCMQKADTGTVDIAIQECNKPDKWLWSTVTSTLNAEQLSVEGEQVTRHTAASKNMVFEYNNGYKKMKTQDVQFSLVYAALLNANSKPTKMTKNIGADKDAALMESVNDLVPLTMMTNKKDTTWVENYRLVCVGGPSNPQLETDTKPEKHQPHVARILIKALTGLLNGNVENGKLTIRSKYDLALSYCAQLLTSHGKNPDLLDKAPTQNWLAQIQRLHLSTEQGNFHSLQRLQDTIEALEYRQLKHLQQSSASAVSEDKVSMLA